MTMNGEFSNARSADVSDPDAIIHAMYDAISGEGPDRDWGRIRSLYLEGARLIPTGLRANGEVGLRLLDVEQWIEGAKPLFAQGPFFEVEVARKMDRFGQIVQAFSTYECRREPDGPAYMTGINSIQLLYKDGRWWVVTVFWDNASEGNPIPSEYQR